MDLLQQFQRWLSRRWPLVLFVVFAVLLGALGVWRDRPPSPITRTLGSSTQPVDVLWVNWDMHFVTVASTDRKVYAETVTRDDLLAIDIGNGATIWDLKLLHGVSGLLADRDTVFVVTAIGVDAYDAETGTLKWSTGLGNGHVAVFSQLDSGVIRVYYGDQIHEVDPKKGEIISTVPKGTTVWISGDIVLRTSPADTLVPFDTLAAFDKQSDEQLWDFGPLFYMEETQEPQAVGEDILIVTNAPGQGWSYANGICALDLRTGEYDWCRRETYITRMAIDHQSQLGYAVRSDFVLVTVDLQTGDILGETSFLADKPPREHPSYNSIIANNGIVVVSFGDGTQTFALKFK